MHLFENSIPMALIMIYMLWFSISGVITVADALDREAVQHYWLTVFATDLGTVPMMSWAEVYIEVLDINDNPPELSQPIYFGTVQENLPKGTSVLKVDASDRDNSSEGKLTYQIVDSQRTYFKINSKTGIFLYLPMIVDLFEMLILLGKGR